MTRSTSLRLRRSERRAQGACRVEVTTPTGWRASSHTKRMSSTVSSGKSRQSWKERTRPTAMRSSGR